MYSRRSRKDSPDAEIVSTASDRGLDLLGIRHGNTNDLVLPEEFSRRLNIYTEPEC